MKNLKNRKVILGVSIAIILVISVIVFYFMFIKNEITFNDKLSKIEYGTQYEYKDMVEKIESKETKVKYPSAKVSEIGKYEAVFQTNKNGNKREQTFEFEIVDTIKPKVTLYINNKDVEVSLNSEYNPITNIKKLENVNEGVIGNVSVVDKKQYANLKKSIKDINKQLKEQSFEIKGDKVSSKSKKAVKIVEENRNRIFYTTNLDSTKEGTYTLKMSIVDENFNIVEKSWKIKVVPKGSLLNSGGTVNCKYIGEDLNTNEAITTVLTENFRYNPYKIVTEYTATTTMTVNADYQTKENLDRIKVAMDEQFAPLMNQKGSSITITTEGYVVTVNILVNMVEYDKKLDPLNILTKKNGANVLIKACLEKAEKDNYVCEIN